MAEVFVPLNRFQSVVTGLTGEPDEVLVINSFDVLSSGIIEAHFGAKWLVYAMTIHPKCCELNCIPANRFFNLIAI